MTRRLLLALVAASAMLAAVGVVFVAIQLLPRISNVEIPGGLQSPNSADKQEQARLAQRLVDGYALQRDGDYASALAAFTEVARAKPELADTKEAQFRLAQTQVLNQDYQSAATALQDFYDRYPKDERHDQATFMLGLCYQQLKQLDKAISFFTDYAKQNSTIDPYTHYEMGLVHKDAGNLSQAVDELGQAVTGSGPRLFEIDAMEKIAEAYMAQKNYDAAAAAYDKIRPRAATDGYKAELNYRIALAYEGGGRLTEAKALFLNVINTYPSASFAALSLDEVNKLDSAAVGAYQAGVVNYLNGRYDQANANFSKVLANPQDNNAADALYFQGMASQQQGNQAQAIAKFDQVIRSYPGSSRVGSAWFQKGESQWRAKSYNDALATFHQFVATLPQDDLASEARWEAAQLLETLQRWDEARGEYAALQQAFPTGKYAADALFRQGLLYFKTSRYDQAMQVWDNYLKTYPGSTDKAKIAYWAGKAAQAAGKQADAGKYLQQAIQATPDEYYGFRAKLITQTVTTTLSIDRVKQNLLASDSDNDRKDMIDWLGRWVSPPPTIGVMSAITVTVQEDPGFKKGQELLRVGLRDEASKEFQDTVARLRSDGIAQFQLALFFRDNQLYQLSIGSAEKLAALSGEKNYLNLPRLLQKLLYPPDYGNLIVGEAEKDNFDPLLLMALIRQESMFNKDAYSAADARGLTQVIPSTGEWLAQKLGLSDFTQEDLFKPYLSVRLGATYLGDVLNQFDGNPFFALAGYNGGPGNVARWSNNNPKEDVDLFLEDIDYSETSLYVRLVMQYYGMYQAIYANPAS